MFSCPFAGCEKSFSKKSRLEPHICTHTKESLYVCEVEGCWKSYTRNAHLKRHIQKAHTEEPTESFCCVYKDCPFSFSSQMILDKHIKKIHLMEGSYKCKEKGCNMDFNKKHQLRAHQIRVHKGILPHQCDLCKKGFIQKSHLDRHKKKHDGVKCKEEGCEKHFEKWSQLRKHMALEHKAELKCIHCNKRFTKKCNLHQHMETHRDLQDRSALTCPYVGCGKSYTAKRNLMAHIQIKHVGLRVPCNIEGCDRTFSTKQKMQEHLPSHDPNRQPLFPKPKRKPRVNAATASGFNKHTYPTGTMELLLTSESEAETKMSPLKIRIGRPPDTIQFSSSETDTKIVPKHEPCDTWGSSSENERSTGRRSVDEIAQSLYKDAQEVESVVSDVEVGTSSRNARCKTSSESDLVVDTFNEKNVPISPLTTDEIFCAILHRSRTESESDQSSSVVTVDTNFKSPWNRKPFK